jgi:hypothetical protein
MREGWGNWLIGTFLAIWAASLSIGLLLFGTRSVPAAPWTFFAFYGAVAAAVGVAAVVELRSGWIRLHRLPPSA